MSLIVAGSTAVALSTTLAVPAEAAAPTKKRKISTKVTQKGQQLFLGGHVGPGNKYRKRMVIIQKKECPKCKWKRVNAKRTNAKSNYRVKIHVKHDGKKDFFRVKTKRGGAFKASFSRVHWVRWV